MIDITGVNLQQFAKEVYNLSRAQGMGILHYQPGPLDDKHADALVAVLANDKRIALDMDYVNGRACKMTVFRTGDKLEIQDSWYDHTAADLEALLSRCGVRPAAEAPVLLIDQGGFIELFHVALVTVAALIIFVFVGMYFSTKEAARKEAEFMVECQEHRPKYECTAMWRAGESKTKVVPVATPVYHAR